MGRGIRAIHAQQRALAGPYDGALAVMTKRLNLSQDQIDDIAQQYGQNAIRVTREASAVVERAAQKATAEIVSKGMHVRQGSIFLTDKLAAAGFSPGKPWLMETLVRTQIQVAYGAGRWNAAQDPVINEILWGFEYVTVGDDRVRPNHAAMDGTKLPKDDPRWGSWWPPSGFNCRCETIEVFEPEDAVEPKPIEVDGKPVQPGPDEGWAFNPGQVIGDDITTNP